MLQESVCQTAELGASGVYPLLRKAEISDGTCAGRCKYANIPALHICDLHQRVMAGEVLLKKCLFLQNNHVSL